MAQLNGTTVNGNLEVSGTISALDGALSISDTTNIGLELGRRDGASGTPYIDFHTNGDASTDYNSRILASGSKLDVTASSGLYVNGTKVSLIDHTHNELHNNTGGGDVSLVYSSGTHYFRPSNATTACGSSSYPWSHTYTDALTVNNNATVSGTTTTSGLTVNGSRITCKPTYDNTTTYATNLYVGTSGIFSRTTNTSSRTIKHDIDDLKNEDLLAENLYNLPVRQFKYNDGIITNEEDARYNKDLVGFIIEEMNEVYPIAVDKPCEDVKDWSWNAHYLIPPMLKLIQDQKSEIDSLKKDVEELKKLINE